MRASGDGQVISTYTRPGPADGAAAEVDEVPVARHAVDRRILVHRRHHHAVLDHHVAQANGVNMGTGGSSSERLKP
jgi:hypothetical protein